MSGGWLTDRQVPRARMAAAYRSVSSGQGLTYARLRELQTGLEDAGAPIPTLIRETEAADFFYDRIVTVEPTDARTVMYDLEVESEHEFVSKGFICHNSQGAEFPAVVLPLLTNHAMMLGRTLLYTAFTRARRLVVVVGQRKALGLAVRDWRRAARSTSLEGLLTGALALRWQDHAESMTPPIDDLPDAWEGLLSADAEQ